MQTEIEAKFLDINADDIRNKLRNLGAISAYPERQMKRKNFDYSDKRLEKIGAWIRVRDEGAGLVTMSYKRLVDRTLHGTKEISLKVDNFESACDFLMACGFDSKAYQETKREKWLLGKNEITIDTWPWIPTFVEIESETEEEIKKITNDLNLDWNLALHGSVETAYQKYYNVTEEEIYSWEEITFVPVPDWLEIKRK